MYMFDPELAIAELEQMRVIIAHHLRQMTIAGDLATAKTFATLLGKTASDASYAVHRIKQSKKCLIINSN